EGGQIDFSRSGTFVYLSGKTAKDWSVAWLDSSGQIEPLLAKPRRYFTPRISPDNQKLALAVALDKGDDIYAYDWRRDILTRLTFTEQGNRYPVWTRDGKHMAYRAPLSHSYS